MKKIYKLSAFVLALIIVAAGLIPAAAQDNVAKRYIEAITEYNLQKTSADSVQEWIDNELTRYAGAGSEWYIIALSNHGKYDFSGYKSALNRYLSENKIGSASSRLKIALTYIAIGDKTNPYIRKALNDSIGEQGIMSLVFGLHLLNNGYKSDKYSANNLVNEILSSQLDDGGFSVMGNHGDVDVTAMTVQALSARYNDSPEIKSAVDAALDFLSDRQLKSGGYSAYGVPNPESCAQVIIALSSLGTDVCADDRFIKNGNTVFDGMGEFLLTDGSFCHKMGGVSDSTATAQALCASVAYENMKSGKPAFYIFDNCVTDSSEAKQTTALPENTSIKLDTFEPTSPEAIQAEPTAVNVTDLTEQTATTQTKSLVENTSDFTSILTTPESDTLKAQQRETLKEKIDYSRIIIIFVCVASVLICAVLFAAKKYKFIAVVIVVAVAVVSFTVKISADKNTEVIGSVTISINCEVIKNEGKSYIPENGIILDETEVEIEKGDTVYDVLSEICKKENILFSANMGYIEGIHNIFETDFGKSSGWIYFVNGEAPSVGCDSYELVGGDKIEWHYTCNLGEDLDIEFKK